MRGRVSDLGITKEESWKYRIWASISRFMAAGKRGEKYQY
jgi:hypothetical protein